MKHVILSDERITDLLTFINRMNLGNGNLIGESKSIMEIVSALETALLNNNEKPKVIKNENEKEK